MDPKTIKTAILALTPQGAERAAFLAKVLPGELFLPEKLRSKQIDAHYYEASFSHMVSTLFSQSQQMVFVMATGIVVRSIAPLLRHKSKDPAVVVVDEHLRFAISLISGHVGGANALALEIETVAGATAVITTATDVNHLFAADVLAKELGCFDERQMKLYKEFNAAFLWKKNIAIVDTCRVFPGKEEVFDLDSSAKKPGTYKNSYFLRGAWIFSSKEAFLEDPREFDHILFLSYQKGWTVDLENRVGEDCLLILVPKNLILGTGCRKNIDPEIFETQACIFLERHAISKEAVAEICSVELKKDEVAMQELVEKWSIPFRWFSAEDLQKIVDGNPAIQRSSFVQRNAGVSAVADPCAYRGSGGRILIPRESGVSSTFALGQKLFYYKEGHFSFLSEGPSPD